MSNFELMYVTGSVTSLSHSRDQVLNEVNHVSCRLWVSLCHMPSPVEGRKGQSHMIWAVTQKRVCSQKEEGQGTEQINLLLYLFAGFLVALLFELRTSGLLCRCSYHLSHCIIYFLSSVFWRGSTEAWTRGLTLARQLFYHLSPSLLLLPCLLKS
jgi:hypothetical protein